MNINPVIISIPIYFLLIGIELFVQRFSRKKIYRLNDAITNISCGIAQQITGAFTAVMMIGAYQYVYEHWSLVYLPVSWWSIILLVLGVDLCYYWAHRMSHEVNLFWGGHVVHHQSEDYNLSVALRQGSFQGLWTFWFYMPLAFLGFDTVTFLFIVALNTVYQFWIHTETIGKLPKPIEFIFNTPSHHRVHHGRNPKYIDKNHAGSLIIWDRIFGTFQEEKERPTYGITKPINTWNPVWANLQHYVDMYNHLRRTPGLGNKWNICFNKPGWKPKEQGGMMQIPEIDHTHAKYDTIPALQLSLYVLIQFAVTLTISAVYLFQLASLTLTYKISFSILIIWSVTQFGLLLDENRKWFLLEYLRVLAIALVTAYLFYQPGPLAIAALYAIISGLWFFHSAKLPHAQTPVKAS